MSDERVPMTSKGHAALKEEVRRLKTVERPRISEEIGRARELGDLKENAEYHAAKEKQGLIEARIKYLEDRLARAEVIDVSKLSGDRVVFGATVELYDVDNEVEVTYTIVGEDEADLEHNKISIKSPIARALIGKSVDDEVTLRTGRGLRTYEILSVRFDPDA
ncbi:MAG: transcription elongation factor GreA [Deltaproteobacteria bacterium]|nr:MAG: transcription elongation factor GreA [Deltaproteobacteria bacterium]